MQNPRSRAPHVAIQRWVTKHGWNSDLGRLWKETWHPKISQDENTFAWQMIYGIPTTLVYRHHWISITDPSLRCTRCSRLQPETIQHTIFSCPASQDIWAWVNILLTSLSTSTSLPPLTLLQVFMADPVHSTIPQFLWQILRKIASFCIWKAQNEHYIPLHPIPWNRNVVIAHIWSRVRIYVQKEWHVLLSKVERRGESFVWAESNIERLLGSNDLIYRTTLHSLVLPCSPPF